VIPAPFSRVARLPAASEQLIFAMMLQEKSRIK